MADENRKSQDYGANCDRISKPKLQPDNGFPGGDNPKFDSSQTEPTTASRADDAKRETAKEAGKNPSLGAQPSIAGIFGASRFDEEVPRQSGPPPSDTNVTENGTQKPSTSVDSRTLIDFHIYGIAGCTHPRANFIPPPQPPHTFPDPFPRV